MSKKGPTKSNNTGKAVKNDSVMTPIRTAEKIMNHFNPQGSILEPCRGTGAFYNLMDPKLRDWCEITDNKDFFDYTTKIDWIITNPPFSIYDIFLEHSFSIADNIVMFVPATKTIRGIKLQAKIDNYGGLKEIVNMGPGSRHGFGFGFIMVCLYYKKDYDGKNIKYSTI